MRRKKIVCSFQKQQRLVQYLERSSHQNLRLILWGYLDFGGSHRWPCPKKSGDGVPMTSPKYTQEVTGDPSTQNHFVERRTVEFVQCSSLSRAERRTILVSFYPSNQQAKDFPGRRGERESLLSVEIFPPKCTFFLRSEGVGGKGNYWVSKFGAMLLLGDGTLALHTSWCFFHHVSLCAGHVWFTAK